MGLSYSENWFTVILPQTYKLPRRERKMLSNLFGKKSDHPLADLESVKKLLEDFPKDDAYKSLAEITEWIESVTERTEFKINHQFAVLRMLDEAAQPHAKKLTREFFTPHEITQFQENRLWMTLDNLSRATASAYFAIFKRYGNDDKGSNTIRMQVPLLLAHAINACVAQLKFICVRYEVIDKAIWENLAQIYKCAELQKCLNTPVSLTSGVAANTTVKCQLARLLSWHGCGVNSLSPLCIHLSERIMAQYSTEITLQTTYSQGDFLSFDVGQPGVPKRISDEATAVPTMCFVGLAGMQPKLEALIKTLEKNILPDDLNLGGAYEAKLVCEVAQKLLDFLRVPPTRQSPRRTIKINLTAVSGFENTVEQITAGLNLGSAKPLHWELEDISANGFLTILPPQGFENLRIGSLLGVQPAGISNWGAAIVRRMSRDDDGRRHVGTEVLANQVACVPLMQSGNAGGGYFEEGQLALWLYPKQVGVSGEVQLLMHADAYSDSRSLQTEIDEKSFLLIPAGLVEKGVDYDLARFRLVEQEGSHHDESY
jgi:hypothetical protein